MTTYYAPAAVNTLARSVAAVVISGSPAVADCYEGNLYTISGSALAEYAYLQGGGFSAATPNGSGGAWLCQYEGSLLEVNGTISLLNLYDLPANATFTGVAVVSGAPYVMNSSGQVLVVSGSSLVDVTGTFTGPAWGLSEYNGSLYTLLASASEIGVLALTSLAAGTVSTIAIPITSPSCFAVSASGTVGVAGTSDSNMAYGFSALDYIDGNVLLLAGLNQANNTLQTFTAAVSRNYTLKQTLTCSGAPSALTWVPNGEQLLVSDASHNVVTVYGLASQTLSVSQTLTVSGATSIGILPNSLSALVCQPSHNLVTVLTNASGTWSIGASVAITNPIAVLMISDTAAVVADGAGLSWLTLSGSTWSVATTSALAYTPTAIAQDSVGGIYVVGASGSTAYLSVFFSQTLVGSASWTGNAVSVLWEQGQIVVGDATNGLARVFGLAAGSYQQLGSLATPATLLTIGVANESLFLADQTQSYQCQFGSPYQLLRTQAGAVALYTGTWSQTVLTVGERPAAVTFDASGNLWIATVENTVYEVTGSGIASTVVVSQNDGQTQSVPVGISSLLWVGSHLYGSSCLKGGLVEIQ